MSLWLRLLPACDAATDDVIILSNGGHVTSSYGVALLFSAPPAGEVVAPAGGVLEARFRRRDGLEWRANTSALVTGRS